MSSKTVAFTTETAPDGRTIFISSKTGFRTHLPNKMLNHLRKRGGLSKPKLAEATKQLREAASLRGQTQETAVSPTKENEL